MDMGVKNRIIGRLYKMAKHKHQVYETMVLVVLKVQECDATNAS